MAKVTKTSVTLLYFPMQKWEKMLLSTSEGVMMPPVMSARASRH